MEKEPMTAPDSSLVYDTLAPEDLAEARSLWASSEGVELCEGDELAELENYLRRNPGHSFAAKSQGRLIGAVLAGHDGRRGYLYHLAVAPAARGQGVGRTLVSLASERLRAAGVRRSLILVARDNVSGKAFWSREGWEVLENALPMGLDL